MAFLCRRIDNDSTSGFAGYTKGLIEGLNGEGVQPLPFNQHPKLGIDPYGSPIAPLYYEMMAPAWRLLRRRGEADIYHAVTETQGMVFPLVHAKKVVTFHHVILEEDEGGAQERIFNQYWRMAAHVSVAQADAIICISEQTKEELEELWDVDPSKMTVINHGINQRFRPDRTDRPFVTIGFVGALNRRKNVEEVLEVLKELRLRGNQQFRLVICGKGPEREKLGRLASRLDIDRSVKFIEHVPEEAMPTLYNSFDAMLYPSMHEGFGFPILEAQSCGTPVIIRMDSRISAEVRKECIKAEGVKGMADEIVALSDSPSRWKYHSDRSQVHALQFTWKRAAVLTNELYDSLLQ